MKFRFGLDAWRMPDVVGFATHWTWIWCVFWSSLFYDAVPPGVWDLAAFAGGAATPSLEPLWLFSLGANVATIGALLALSRIRNPFSALAALPWLAALLTSAGTLLIGRVVLELLAPVAEGAYIVGAVLTGVGSGVVVVLWGELLAGMGSRQTVAFSVVALLMAAVAYVVVTLLPVDAAQLLVAVLPIVNMLFYRHFRRSAPQTPRSMRNMRVQERPPYRMMLIALFFGFSFGGMKGLMTPMGPEWLGLRDALNIAAIAVGALAVYVTTGVCKMDFNHLTYQVALPLMAAGFLFLPLHEPYSVIGTAVHQCGYQYFYIVLWATWPILVSRAHVPAAWVVTWGMASIQLGQLVGSVAAALAVGLIHDELGRAMLSAVIVFAILLVVLFVFGNKTAETGWGFVRPAEAEGPISAFDDAVSRLARRYRLSPREVEVLFLLARGRNRSFIAAELTIGDETVKSHIKSVYRKMDLHSQQDVIDLVESESAQR